MKFKKQFYLLFICLWAGITKTTFAQQPATYDYVVSSNGKGNFTTIQEAINAVPDFRKKQTRILEEFYKLKYCSTVVYMVPRA